MTPRSLPSVRADVCPSADLRARVMAAVEREPVGSRSVGIRRRLVFAIISATVLVALSLAMVHPGLGGRPIAYVVALGVAWAFVAASATWAGTTRGRSMLGRSLAWRIGVVLWTPLALLAVALVVGSAWSPTPRNDAGLGAHLVCLGMTTALALGPLGVLLALHGATDPIGPRLTGAAIAAAAGAWGAVAIALHCPVTTLSHVIFGHILPVVLVALVGLAAGRVVAVRPENG